MESVRVLENITCCSMFNCLRPFGDFNHQSNKQQPPLPLLIGDMRCSTKQFLAGGACNYFCVFLGPFCNASTLPLCLLHECAPLCTKTEKTMEMYDGMLRDGEMMKASRVFIILIQFKTKFDVNMNLS